jgi:UDP-hydrolysing UDP-N-acetyl-D-glucosamine 2-epimerase
VKLAAFSSGRQDAGIIAPVLRACAGGPVQPLLVCAGLHLRSAPPPASIEGIPVAAWLDALPAGDDDAAIAAAAAATTAQLAPVLIRLAADALLVAGDRSETLAAALAATCLRLPIVHLHGGEITTGAIDDACRDAISQLAQLHAVAHAPARDRLIAMGIDARRIAVTGAPGLDACFAPVDAGAATELAAHLKLTDLPHPLITLTHHPATLGGDPTSEIAAVLAGVDAAICDHPDAVVVATAANCDAGGERINAALAAHCANAHHWRLVHALGHRLYRTLLAHADVVVGNSSSGIIEAPVFGLPVLNIGARQDGRHRCPGIVDLPADPTAIADALRVALQQPRRPHPARAAASDYGDGHAGPRIASLLAAFADLPPRRRLDRSGALP